MKKLFVLSSTLASLSAFAAVNPVVVSCHPSENIADGGTYVTIEKKINIQSGNEKPFIAKVSEETLAGPRPFKDYGNVEYVPSNPKLLGSTPKYEDDGFVLDLHTDSAPRQDGQIGASLEARNDQGAVIRAEVLCLSK